MGTTDPAITYQDSLVWSITPIVGSNLSISPPSAKGRTVTFTFEHLPDSNNQFGNKYIKAELPNWNLAESVLVKVFYPKYANNHPPGPDWWNNDDPNWYYYWGQTRASIPWNIFSGDYCNDTTYGYYLHYGYGYGENNYHACSLACEMNTSGVPFYVTGIDCFGVICEHESTHDSLWHAWWGSLQYDSTTADPDSDFIPSAREYERGLDSLDSRTFGDTADFEIPSLRKMLRWWVGSVDDSDWCNPGHQY